MTNGRERVERRLAAIFAADVADYSRMMEQDELGLLRLLTVCRVVTDRLIAEHGGRIANYGWRKRHGLRPLGPRRKSRSGLTRTPPGPISMLWA